MSTILVTGARGNSHAGKIHELTGPASNAAIFK